MAIFKINGGNTLRGQIKVSGMKNAAAPIFAASLLTAEPVALRNIPEISDLDKLAEIMRSMGIGVERQRDGEVVINAANINPKTLDTKAVSTMRAAVLLIGPLLARCRELVIPEPGGCIIGRRPLHAHLAVVEQFGGTAKYENGVYHFTLPAALKGVQVVLPEFSVTATENALMLASLAEGRSVIKLAAAEPHVVDLIHFLQKMGVKIFGEGTHTLIVEGAKKLYGVEHQIIPDQIEVGTFAVAAAATGGDVTISGIDLSHLDIILLKLTEAGVRFECDDQHLRILPGGNLKNFTLQTFPYPGFPTDLQAPFGVLATQCRGTSLIKDPMFEGRLGYANELVKMGANAIIADPHRVIITGPTPLYGTEINSLDLRAGATLVIAGLIAQGQTVLKNAEVLDRGYEKLLERLNSLGADIARD